VWHEAAAGLDHLHRTSQYVHMHADGQQLEGVLQSDTTQTASDSRLVCRWSRSVVVSRVTVSRGTHAMAPLCCPLTPQEPYVRLDALTGRPDHEPTLMACEFLAPCLLPLVIPC
jgi:hypothetical protein